MAKFWQISKNPNEIMRYVELSPKLTKWQVLKYFVKQDDQEMVEKLLKPRYFFPRELARMTPTYYSELRKSKSREMVEEYACQSWKQLSDIGKIMDSQMNFVSNSHAINKKIEYLKENRPEELLEWLENNEVKNETYTDTLKLELLMDDPEKNAEKIVYLMATSHRCLELINAVPKYRELSMRAERKMIELKKSVHWKDCASASLVMFYATEENKWQILEYFAENNLKIFSDITKGYTRRTKRVDSERVVFECKEVVDRYNGKQLSPAFKQYVESCKQMLDSVLENRQKAADKKTLKFQQLQNEKQNSWLENQETQSFFKLGNINVGYRQDYIQILQKYLQEDMSRSEFCKVYGITSEAGFNQMIEKLCSENAIYAEQIKTKESGDNISNDLKLLIANVCLGKEPLEKLLAKSKRVSLTQAKDILNQNWGKKAQDVFMLRVIKYYHDRACAIDTSSIEPENIANMLKTDEIRFVVGNNNYKALLSGKELAVPAPFINASIYLHNEGNRVFSDMVRGKTPGQIEYILSKYNRRFNKENYLKADNQIINDKGEVIDITPELIDKAYGFVLSKDIVPSSSVMNLAIRSVANGKIDESVKEDKQNLINQSLKLIEKINSISDYFEYIDQLSNN